jgi:hypothetical protein
LAKIVIGSDIRTNFWRRSGAIALSGIRPPTTARGSHYTRVAVFKEPFTNPGYVRRGRSHSFLAEATIIDFVGPTSKHFTHEYNLSLKGQYTGQCFEFIVQSLVKFSSAAPLGQIFSGSRDENRMKQMKSG